MSAKSGCLFPILAGAVFCAGCASTTAGKAAKRDAATVRRETVATDAALSRAQDDGSLLKAGDAVLRSDAQRIDDKAVVLLRSRWKP